MKMKEFGPPRGGARPWRPPLDPPMHYSKFSSPNGTLVKMWNATGTYQSTLLRFTVFPLLLLVGGVEDPQPAGGGKEEEHGADHQRHAKHQRQPLRQDRIVVSVRKRSVITLVKLRQENQLVSIVIKLENTLR